MASCAVKDMADGIAILTGMGGATFSAQQSMMAIHHVVNGGAKAPTSHG